MFNRCVFRSRKKISCSKIAATSVSAWLITRRLRSGLLLKRLRYFFASHYVKKIKAKIYRNGQSIITNQREESQHPEREFFMGLDLMPRRPLQADGIFARMTHSYMGIFGQRRLRVKVKPRSYDSRRNAGLAEWQTQWIQNPPPARASRFKSEVRYIFLSIVISRQS